MIIAQFVDFPDAMERALEIQVNQHLELIFRIRFISNSNVFFFRRKWTALHGKILGIMSWIFTCALGVPDGFTRVSVHVPWIEQEIRLSGTQSLL